MSERLNCPFCGSDDISDGEMLTRQKDGTCFTQSECQGCGAFGPVAEVDGPDYGDVRAIAAWNRRAPEPAEHDGLRVLTKNGREVPFAFYNADSGRFFWLNETTGAPIPVSGIVNLYLHADRAAPDSTAAGDVSDDEILSIMREHLDHGDGGYICDVASKHVIAAGRALLRRLSHRAGDEPVATVCLAGDSYANGYMQEVQVQLRGPDVPRLKIGDKLYAPSAPVAGSGE